MNDDHQARRVTGQSARTAASPGAVTPPRRRNSFALWVVVMPLALLLLVACAAFATGMATAPDTTGVDTAPVIAGAIDPSDYAVVEPQVQALAGSDADQLHARFLADAPPVWGRLDPQQQAAVAAAWQRYLRDPAGFAGADTRAYYLQAFDGYLLALGHARGDRQALIDRGRLQLAEHESLARQRWSDASILFPDDPLLEALATEHSLPGKAWHWTGRGVFHWVERLTGRSLAERMRPR